MKPLEVLNYLSDYSNDFTKKDRARFIQLGASFIVAMDKVEKKVNLKEIPRILMYILNVEEIKPKRLESDPILLEKILDTYRENEKERFDTALTSLFGVKQERIDQVRTQIQNNKSTIALEC